MQILSFDTQAGRYAFEAQGLSAELHAHPLNESIQARTGSFSLWLNGELRTGLTAARIPANTPHRLDARQATVRIGMEEPWAGNVSASFVIDQRVQRCISLVQERGTDTLPSLKALAAACHLSQSWMGHLFLQVVGCSLSRFIMFERLKRTIAQQLDHSLTLGEAALNHGFYDSAHFSRTFKDFFGVAPSIAYNSQSVQAQQP